MYYRAVFELQLHVHTGVDVAPMHHISANTWIQRYSASWPPYLLPQINWSYNHHTEHCPHHNAPTQLQWVSVCWKSFILICNIMSCTVNFSIWSLIYCGEIYNFPAEFYVNGIWKYTDCIKSSKTVFLDHNLEDLHHYCTFKTWKMCSI